MGTQKKQQVEAPPQAKQQDVEVIPMDSDSIAKRMLLCSSISVDQIRLRFAYKKQLDKMTHARG